MTDLTPNEIAALPIVKRGNLQLMTNYRANWPGFPDEASWSEEIIPGLDVRWHGQWIEDERREGVIFSVLFQGSLVAVGQHAGRELDDHVCRWIVSRDGFMNLAKAIRIAVDAGEEDPGEIASADAPIPDFLNFYGCSITPGETTWRRW